MGKHTARLNMMFAMSACWLMSASAGFRCSANRPLVHVRDASGREPLDDSVCEFGNRRTMHTRSHADVSRPQAPAAVALSSLFQTQFFVRSHRTGLMAKPAGDCTWTLWRRRECASRSGHPRFSEWQHGRSAYTLMKILRRYSR